MIEVVCHACGQKVSLAAQPGRRDECGKCRADLHCCKNCRHYDPKVYNECRETQADRVQERDRSNFCDYFEAGSGLKADDAREKARLAAEKLFKK